MSTTKPTAIVFVDDLYECLEFHYPRLRLIEAGYEVHTVGIQAAVYKSKEGYWGKATKTPSEIDPKTVDVVVVPGGFCTDRLRRYPEVLQLLRECWGDGVTGAVVGFICHGGWLPISAGIVKGRTGTCFFAIKDDLINAGMKYVEDKCYTDGRMVTAQTPEDLPQFMAAILALPPRTKS